MSSLPSARMNAVGHWNIAHPTGHNVCFHSESTAFNCLLHKLIITKFVLVLNSNAEQAVWIVLWSEVVFQCQTALPRFGSGSENFSIRILSVDDRLSVAFGLNRESTTRAWHRGVLLDSRPIQTPYGCPSNPGCSIVCRQWNIHGLPGHV